MSSSLEVLKEYLSDNNVRSIVKYFIISRLIVWLIGVLFFNCFKIFDYSSSLLNLKSIADTNANSVWDTIIVRCLGMFSHWDGEHFLVISERGYINEKMFAFFPGVPLLISTLVRVTLCITNMIGISLSVRSAAILCGYLWNTFTSFCSALLFYNLTLLTFTNETMARMSVQLYLFNPASIFFNAIYTESTFFMFVLIIILSFECWMNNVAKRGLILSMVTMVGLFGVCLLRSNGIILIGFPLYYALYQIINHRNNRFFVIIFQTLITIMIGLSPFIAFQYYAKNSLCVSAMLDRPYCEEWYSLVYQFVQKQYWNVGLFRYYTLSQIPNFILAVPIWMISLGAITHYSPLIYRYLIIPIAQSTLNSSENSVDTDDYYQLQSISIKICPHLVYLSVVLCICISVLHVQVSTRFICSSCPLIYWYCAQMNINATVDTHTRMHWSVRYSVAYLVIGTAMFATYLPFT